MHPHKQQRRKAMKGRWKMGPSHGYFCVLEPVVCLCPPSHPPFCSPLLTHHSWASKGPKPANAFSPHLLIRTSLRALAHGITHPPAPPGSLLPTGLAGLLFSFKHGPEVTEEGNAVQKMAGRKE